MCKMCVRKTCMTFFAWVLIVVMCIDQCSTTATFQVDVGTLLGAQKRNSPLSSIIDYRQTNLETVKSIHFKYYDRCAFVVRCNNSLHVFLQISFSLYYHHHHQLSLSLYEHVKSAKEIFSLISALKMNIYVCKVTWAERQRNNVHVSQSCVMEV